MKASRGGEKEIQGTWKKALESEEERRGEGQSISTLPGGCGNMGISDARLNSKRVSPSAAPGLSKAQGAVAIRMSDHRYQPLFFCQALSGQEEHHQEKSIMGSRGCFPIAVTSRTRQQKRTRRAELQQGPFISISILGGVPSGIADHGLSMHPEESPNPKWSAHLTFPTQLARYFQHLYKCLLTFKREFMTQCAEILQPFQANCDKLKMCTLSLQYSQKLLS